MQLTWRDCSVVRCDAETDSDYVELSNFNVEVVDRKMSRLCGTTSAGTSTSLPPGVSSVYRSDARFFRVTFYSNDVYDATGFQATYHFHRLHGALRSLLVTVQLHNIVCVCVAIDFSSQRSNVNVK